MHARRSLLLVSMMLVASAVLREAKSAPPASGLLVVANQKEHTLLVVDPDNRRELAKISVGVNGHEVIVSKDGHFAYVPIYGNSGVGRPGTDGSTIDVTIDVLAAQKLVEILQRRLVHWAHEASKNLRLPKSEVIDVALSNTSQGPQLMVSTAQTGWWVLVMSDAVVRKARRELDRVSTTRFDPQTKPPE